ncbi:MAG: transcriptional regulator [Bacteroidetes bacterium]|nr:MAG: transcriptional regulator [Bacteroidota bacterium]
MSDTKNDVAWIKLFEKYKIAENVTKENFFEIKSTQINGFREARLMTKFDYKSQLPEIFAKNNLSILPNSRGSYIISSFETFKDFETKNPIIENVEFPSYIESIDYNNITSESAALNCAYVSGIIEDFVQDENLKPTVNGRMSSSNFDFNINSKDGGILNIDVKNSQIEIDGGYEGLESLSLIEAKNSLSKDFLIRQVYYPYRLWSNKISKKVKPLFLTYTNGIFHFREYEFEDSNLYNSLVLKREKKYTISEDAINTETIQTILKSAKMIKEPEVAFPQADSFERVINLCELLNEFTILDRDYITENYDFDSRQTNYYTDAARYLGIIDKKLESGKVLYFLTEQGNKLFDLSIFDRQLEFIRLILIHSTFNETLNSYFKESKEPSKQEVVKIMKGSRLYNVKSESTFQRRSSTVTSWINWILEQIEE